MFAIAPTDINWFTYLKKNNIVSNVNFWTPTPWNVQGLSTGDRFFFMLKSPIRKLGGYGEFVQYQNLTVLEAWNRYGLGNGVRAKYELEERLKHYALKRSQKAPNNIIEIGHYPIGCIELTNCHYWEEENYTTPEQYNISFPNQVVKLKYYKNDFLLSIDEEEDPGLEFSLVEEEREHYSYITNGRCGQSVFKAIVTKAYDRKCCISNEVTPELLEAAHIQEYRSKISNHIQNGLLLRIDLHRLFDANLLYIDDNYIVHISSLIKNPYYKKLDGITIRLPKLAKDYPSKQALLAREANFRL